MLEKPKIKNPNFVKPFDYHDEESASKGLHGDAGYVMSGAETRLKAKDAQSKLNDINKKRAEGKLDG